LQSGKGREEQGLLEENMDLTQKQRAQVQYDDGTRILSNLANSSSKTDDLQEAIKHFQEATKLNPMFAFAFHNLAHAWYNVAECNEAFGDLLGFRLNPKKTEAHRRNALKLALKAVDRAIEIQQVFPQAHNTRAMILAKLFRLNEAMESVEVALSQNPDYENASNNRGKIEVLMMERETITEYKNEEDFQTKADKAISELNNVFKKLRR
jgi:tetratricopeptide (TPR) repeat protein